eukprot:8829825-Heterocapsa_arctica.AAC.1
MENQEQDKVRIIRQIYYGENGFGSIKDTWEQSKQLMNSITINDVKGFLEKQKNRQTKAYSGFNSYVAHKPNKEFQSELMDFTESAKDKKWVQ